VFELNFVSSEILKTRAVTVPIKLKLIPILDKVQLDYCEVCEQKHELLLWTGRMTIGVECDKNRFIAAKLIEREKGLTLQEFLVKLCCTPEGKRVLNRVLPNYHW
jgi:hypothetical protein